MHSTSSKVLNYNFKLSHILICIPGPCDVKIDKNKQQHFYKRTPVAYYMTACSRHANPEIKSKHTDDQSSHRSLIFFGQVYIVSWLSYSQVREKISVEPCNGTLKIPCKRPLEGHVTVAFWEMWQTVYCRL